MKLIELSQALEHWHQTKSVAESTEICEQLYQDLGKKAREDYAEPTIHFANPSNWLGTLPEEERKRIARVLRVRAKNHGAQA